MTDLVSELLQEEFS